MIISNINTIQIFIVTFLAVAVNIILPTILFIRAKSISKDKKSFIKKIIFFVIIPEIIVLLTSIYLVYRIVLINIIKI